MNTLTTTDTATASIPNTLRWFDNLPDSKYVGTDVVLALEGFSAPTLWRRIRLGLFPVADRQLGPNGRGPRQWLVSTLRNHREAA